MRGLPAVKGLQGELGGRVKDAVLGAPSLHLRGTYPGYSPRPEGALHIACRRPDHSGPTPTPQDFFYYYYLAWKSNKRLQLPA